MQTINAIISIICIDKRLITLTKFCVTLNASQNSKNTKGTSREHESYIIHPIDIQIKMTKLKINNDPLAPILSLDIRIAFPLIIMLNKDQKNYLIKLNNLITNLEII